MSAVLSFHAYYWMLRRKEEIHQIVQTNVSFVWVKKKEVELDD